MHVKDDDERLDAVVNVRLLTAEKDQLRRDAETAGLSMSELVRRQYFNQTIRSHVDEVLINELRRLGGLLKHTHNITGGVHAGQTGLMLTKISSLLDQIG